MQLCLMLKTKSLVLNFSMWLCKLGNITPRRRTLKLALNSVLNNKVTTAKVGKCKYRLYLYVSI